MEFFLWFLGFIVVMNLLTGANRAARGIEDYSDTEDGYESDTENGYSATSSFDDDPFYSDPAYKDFSSYNIYND